MVRKLILAGFILAFGLWLVVRPQFTEGLTWQDCTTAKGVICVPRPAERASICEITDRIMLRRLRTTIAGTIAFLLDVPNWLDNKPAGREFEQRMPGPELRAPANRLPRDPG